MQQIGQFMFHLIAFSNFAFGIYYDLYILKFPEKYLEENVQFAGRWKYLTFWNMVLQLVYFSLCIINDILGSSTLKAKDRTTLQKIRDYLFGSLVNPLGLFVACSFWSLWAVDRNLVFPVELDTFFPVWLNHIMHTSIVPFDFIEMISVSKIYPSRASALKGLMTLMLSYCLWVFFIAYHTHYWVYPILAVLHWGYRLAFITGCVFMAFIFYFIGEKLHYTIWGKAIAEVSLPRKKQEKKRK